MLRAFKYYILPTEEQQNQLTHIFGCVRFVYNLGLETKITAYRQYGKTFTCFDLISQVVDLKQDAHWLKECPSQALQMSIRNLDNAYSAFFRGAGFPKFKTKKSKQSFQLPQGVKIDLEKGKVFLPKLNWVDCVFSRELTGKIKTVTVSRVPSGKYYVSFLVDTQQAKPEKKPICRETAVGIELGLKPFATLSDGQVFQNHQFLSKSLNRLDVEQRTLSRRFQKSEPEQSKGWHKQKLIVARLYEKITNQRRDFPHKVSTAWRPGQIINEYNTVCLETFSTRDIIQAAGRQNRRLSRAISELGWAEFNRMLDYKAEWYGKTIVRIGLNDPSHRICPVCGWPTKELTLSSRVWPCANGHVVDGDRNVAQTIKDFGLRAKPLRAKEGQ